MTQLHLYLLGPPEVRLDNRLVAFPTRKTLALLAYLALEPGPQAREQLATLLWPDVTPERSLASLRNTLGHLQAILRRPPHPARSPHLTITHQALALNFEAGLTFDLQTVEHAYRLARAERSSRAPPDGSASVAALQAAVACHRGDFLAGFSLGDASGFDDWVDIHREAWRRRLGLILDRLSEIQFARGELASVAETVARWIGLDGLNEVAYRRKMRAHFAAGERGQALATYEACRALLASELGLTPEPDTEALAARIRAQQAAPAPLPRLASPGQYLESVFAGRRREQQALQEGFLRAAAGQPEVIVIRGEAGIGKTRLATAFLTWARAQGAEVLQGGAVESASHMPFGPWAEMLRSALERAANPPDWLDDPWRGLLLHLMPEVRERFPDWPAPPRLEAAAGPPVSPAQVFEALARFTLSAARQAPLVVFLDDLQWADGATLEAVQYAARRWRASAARVLGVFCLRSEAPPAGKRHTPDLNDWLTQVEREVPVSRWALEPLDEPEVLQMVHAILAPAAPDFAQWVFNETRGHPFYLMETLKDLLERGALHPHRRAEGQWAFAVDAEHDLGMAVRVPSTVRAVINSRLKRLSPRANVLLAAAAVLHQRLTFERLCAVANLAADLGLAALDELLSSQLLLETASPGGHGAYVFANEMVRDVVYTEAGDARRRLFHQRALGVLEAAHDPAAMLARHALAAGVTEEAFRHSLSAGQEAARLAALGEAQAHFDTAHQMARETALAGAALVARADAMYAQLSEAYQESGQPEQTAPLLAERAQLASPASTD